MREKIAFVDTHTGGEPTRVIRLPERIASSFEADWSIARRCRELREQYDWLRRSIIHEPRGNDVLVAAILLDAEHQGSVAGVVFVNNIGYLGMCGHGTIGVAVALQQLGEIQPGTAHFDTPVGTVACYLEDAARVSIQNVSSYRYRRSVAVKLSDGSTVHGDIAWGGNWFFICEDHGADVVPNNISGLHERARQVRTGLRQAELTGADGAEIDHVELIGPPSNPDSADSRNFVLCPGGEYDRSPCGTGTSAKLACLAADALRKPGEVYRQESIVGSVFEATYQADVTVSGAILPTITGSAYVTAEGSLVLDSDDPFCKGISRV